MTIEKDNLAKQIQGEKRSQNNHLPVKEMHSMVKNFTMKKTPHANGFIGMLPNIQETDNSTLT